MMKTYKIGNKKIEGLSGNSDYLRSKFGIEDMKSKINELLEALEDKEETKNDVIDKILSLVVAFLLKEIEEQGKRVAPENYDIYQARQDIIKIINNLTK